MIRDADHVVMESQFPNLHRLLVRKVVRVENNEYVGTAADGTVVTFGTVYMDEQAVENYLKSHPTAEDW